MSSSTMSVCTVSGNTVSILTAGTCGLTASQDGDGNYNPATPADQSVNIAKADQTITFAAPADQTFSVGGTFDSPATSSSNLTVLITSTTTGVCTVSGNTITILSSGTCSLTASQVGDENYNTATPVIQHIAIGKENQSISEFTATPASGLFNGTSTLNAVSDAYTTNPVKIAGLPITFGSITIPVCTVNANIVNYHTIGICTVTADQPGDENYNPAPQVTLDITVDAIVPDAPAIINIIPGFRSVTVFFEPPVSDGGSPVTNYIVNCNGKIANGTTSPIIVENLNNGEIYNCSVVAQNIAGSGDPSSAQGTAIPAFPVPTLSNWGQLLLALSFILIIFGYTRRVRS